MRRASPDASTVLAFASGPISNTFPPAKAPAGECFFASGVATPQSSTPSRLREVRPVCDWWRPDDHASLQGDGNDCFKGRPGRVLLWLLTVGVADRFILTSLTLDSPASG
ncbi:hypothetical protein SV7mr_46190 [Stieleria bergensis]|uniref:Uncharacterized protein n=1 Tax=Stieleria bergensis TaxID=2528025 RepID=A0A517T129_9BACT|nr:hypothetical protein SV7mr_46190 [Planctomycetes bacterium SV_7m_r]